MPIRFFSEDVDFKIKQPNLIRKWIYAVTILEGFSGADLNYIFCSDGYLLEINNTHLQHDFYTDIITFNLSDNNSQLEGEIYISIDRVSDNASGLNQPFLQELLRVLIHGVLHLIGYADKAESEILQMRLKEDIYISLWNNQFNIPRGK